MKTLILCFILLTTISARAEEDILMRPGEWNVLMTVKGKDGAEINPGALIKAAMAKMTDEQKEQLKKAMGNIDPAGVSGDGVKICYSEAQVKNPEAIATQDSANCPVTVVSKTRKEVKTTFECKDGAKGTAHWTIKNPREYVGVVELDSPKTGKSKLNYLGKFIQKECGAKPAAETPAAPAAEKQP